ncbi:hypothetical protein F5Y17DRAFT_470900 [Xylariaceae sp. FL0594]|nr:hypothetical protein F5Y17DRAFT_470900 [Xylariaceae sp. FL0594]
MKLFLIRMIYQAAAISDGRVGPGLRNAPGAFAVVRKLIYGSLWAYFYQQLFAKLSILALYYRLFWVKPRFKWCIDSLVIYHLIWIAITSFVLGFHCQPLAKFWHPALPGHCNTTGTLLAVADSLNSFGDFLLVAFAVSSVTVLRMSNATKRKLVFFFGLGILAGVIGFIKIGFSFSNDAVYVFNLVGTWSNVQSAVGMVCCCAPVCQPLLPAPGFWTRIASKLGLSTRRRSQSQSAKNRSNPTGVQASRHDGGQYWTEREDASSRGLVSSGGCSEGPTQDEYSLHVIQARRDVEVSGQRASQE